MKSFVCNIKLIVEFASKDLKQASHLKVKGLTHYL